MLWGGERTLIWLAVLTAALPGCAAMHPMKGIPVQKYGGPLPTPLRNYEETIDLSLLRQNPPPDHIVGPRDVLGIYIEGILGDAQHALPTYQPALPNIKPSLGYPVEVRQDGTISLPYVDPIPVVGMTIAQVERQIRTVYTEGKPLLQPGQDRILVSLQQPRTYRVLVVRQEAGGRRFLENQYESSDLQQDKRGSGHVLHLPAFQNDVLHALAETGGLPGLDAQNVIYVIRQQGPRPLIPSVDADHWKLPPAETPFPGNPRGHSVSPTPPGRVSPLLVPPPVDPPESAPPDLQGSSTFRDEVSVYGHSLASGTDAGRSVTAAAHDVGHSFMPFATSADRHATHDFPGADRPNLDHVQSLEYPAPPPSASDAVFLDLPPAVQTYAASGATIIQIPLRVLPGTPPSFTREEIILRDGDVVFIESRDDEYFYTGGLLGGGRYRLPRDRDLDLVEAISLVEGEGRVARPSRAIGGSSVLNQDVTAGASRVIIHRLMPDGTRVPLKVNLYQVLKDPNRTILIQPDDRIYLRYSALEAPFAFIERHLLEGAIIGAASSLTFGN